MMQKSSTVIGLGGLSGGLLVLALCAAPIVLALLLFVGAAAIATVLFPLASALAILSVGAFLCIVLPLSLVPARRPALASASLQLSLIVRVAIWMYSFILIVNLLGGFALFTLLIFRAVAPIAIIALMLGGEGVAAMQILIGLAIAYGMRAYGRWLAPGLIASSGQMPPGTQRPTGPYADDTAPRPFPVPDDVIDV
jgi:hypothetical protein